MCFPDMPVALPVGPQEPVEQPHWDGLKNGELRIQQCENCGTWIWSPSWVCPRCHQLDPVWRSVEMAGTVYSWTRTHHAFPASREFADALPYVTALVEIPAAGNRRLFGIVVGGGDVRIGAPVRGWIQPGSELTGGWAVLRWVLQTEESLQTEEPLP
jgi:uncharacterized OB-fold protein